MPTFKAFPLDLTILLLALPACVGGPVAADTVSTMGNSVSGPSSTAATDPGATASSGSSTSTTTGGSGECAWASGDDQCDMCIKDSCCDQLKACEANEDCACLLACINVGGPQICDQCATPPMKVPEFGALFECMGEHCTDPCT